MGSAAVDHHATDDRLHVAYDWCDRMWWAVHRGGSYGGSRNRKDAITTAIDAALILHVPVVIHGKSGCIQYTLTKFKRHRPSSQFFQDDVE